MLKSINLSDKGLLLISLFTVVVCSIAGANILYLLGLLIFAYLYSLWGKDFVINFVIISSLTLVSDLGASLRLAVNIVSISALLFLFLNKYGFNLEKYPAVNSTVLLYLFALILLMVLTSFTSNDTFAGLILTAKTITFFVLIYFFYSLINGEKEINLFRNSIITASIVLVLFALFNMIRLGQSIFDINTWIYLRFSGLIGNPNGTAAFYAISIPLITGKILTTSMKKIKIYIPILIILIIGLLFTVSRGAFLSLAVSITFYFFFMYRKVLIKSVIISAILITLIVLVPTLNETFTALFRLEEGVSQRDILWELAINMIADNFWLGIGPGSFTNEMFNYIPVMLDSWHGIFLQGLADVTQGSNLAHNFYLSFFSEMGILGLVASVILPGIFFNIGYKTMKYYKDFDKAKYINTLIMLSIGVGLFIRGFFEGINLITFGWITMDLPFWLVFASLLYYYEQSKISSGRNLVGIK
jgi:O-antigen ligase